MKADMLGQVTFAMEDGRTPYCGSQFSLFGPLWNFPSPPCERETDGFGAGFVVTPFLRGVFLSGGGACKASRAQVSTDRNAKAEAASHLATLVLTCVHWLTAPGIATAGKLLLGSFDGKPCCLRRLEQTDGPLCDAKRLEGDASLELAALDWAAHTLWQSLAGVGRPRCTGIFASAAASRVDMRRAGLQNIYMYLDNPASDWTALDNPASDWTALDNHPNPLLVRLAGPERD
jgi:hypothetical protein